MKFVLNLTAAAAAAFALTGCASMISGSTQEVKVSTNPVGATVYIGTIGSDGTLLNRRAVGVTPLTVALPRKDGGMDVEKAGYLPQQVNLTTKMNPMVWGDIIMLSPLSTSVDTSTGAAKEYDPGEYMIDLKPVPAK
jgi:hypothetical protein